MVKRQDQDTGPCYAGACECAVVMSDETADDIAASRKDARKLQLRDPGRPFKMKLHVRLQDWIR